MESDRMAPEIQKLLAEVSDLAKKDGVGWADVVTLEKEALNIYFSKPELRMAMHHKFTDALARLQSIDHNHKRASDALFMLHNLAMHPITGRGQIDEVIKYSGEFGLKGDLTYQDIESLMDTVQKGDQSKTV